MEENVNSKAEILSSTCRRLTDNLKLLGVNGLLSGLVLTLGTPGYETNNNLTVQLSRAFVHWSKW